MPRRGGITIEYDHFPRVSRNLADKTRKQNIDTANEVATDARLNAAEDTGSMEASIYVASSEGSDYGSAVAAAEDINPDVEIVPEVEPPSPDAAVVGVAAKHGEFNEYGTVNMAAQPFMTPAAESNRAPHIAAIDKIIKSL